MKVKVLCITYDYVGPYSSFSVRDFIKIGEWYDAYQHKDAYAIIDEFGNVKCYLAKDYFKTTEQIREDKLNELGI